MTKKLLFLFVWLIIAVATFGQGTYVPSLGSPNGTQHIRGGLIPDSAFGMPLLDIYGKPYKNKGLDTNGRYGVYSVDTLPYYMKNGVWARMLTAFDSGILYITPHKADSIAGIIADSGVNVYNSDGALLGNRTVNADSFYFKIEDASSIVFNSLSGVDINAGSVGVNISAAGAINLNGQKVIRYGQQIAPSVVSSAYGDTVDLNSTPNIHDIEFTGSSGASSVLLPTSNAVAPVGTEYIVSDLGLDCLSNPIEVDAGSGKVIVGHTSAQTYTLEYPGQVVRFKKVTTTAWKIDVDSINLGVTLSVGDTVIGANPTSLMVVDENLHVSTPHGVTYVDSENNFRIRNLFVVDSAARNYRFGDINNVYGVGSPRIDAGLTSWIIYAGNISLQGSLNYQGVNTGYGATLTLSASDAIYNVFFTSGSGASGVNLPTGIGGSVGRTYVIHDVDGICSTSPITIDAGVGNTIVGPSSSAQTFVMGVNGMSVTLVKMSATKWKIY